ncbi:MAG: ComEC/Rec2 family competence protein [Clostridium sp.]
MTQRKNAKKLNKPKTLVGGIIALVVVLIGGYFGLDLTTMFGEANLGPVDGEMMISYMNVGQGDAAYIKVNDFDILIDAGPRSDVENLMSQLESKNIDDFEIVIATHPHEDHIGGMTDVFKKYDVENFYMPKVSHTTKTFEYMMNAVSNEGIKAKPIKEGTTIELGSGARIDVYSPLYETYENLNDYSPIMKLSYGENSFIFTGDAEYHSEKEVVAKYPTNLRADVLKFGHHGSSTSSTIEFVDAVAPEYGIISCGVDNKYGHPHRETLDTIKKKNIKTFRTDTQGEITLISDGKDIKITTEK